jgi:hypothetical protein
MLDQIAALRWTGTDPKTAAQVKQSSEFSPVSTPYTAFDLQEAFKKLLVGFYARGLKENIRWGYKDHNHYYPFDLIEINKIFPGAQFIVLRRNGPDCCTKAILAPWVREKIEGTPSLLGVDVRASMDSLVSSVILTYLQFNTFASNVYKNRTDVRVIEYEDLVRSPEHVIEHLSQFLNLRQDGWNIEAFETQLSTKLGKTPSQGSYGFMTEELVREYVDKWWRKLVVEGNVERRERDLRWNVVTGRHWRWY